MSAIDLLHLLHHLRQILFQNGHGESNKIREGFEKIMGNCRLAFSFYKFAFVQAQNKLKACQKKANYEDGLVRNLEMYY
jgi:hypothetical protein